MKKSNINKFILITLFSVPLLSNLHSQGCVGYGCLMFSIVPHRLSYQYGQFENKLGENGYYHGGEFYLFYDYKSLYKFNWGIKFAIGKRTINDLTNTISSGALELNYLLPGIGRRRVFNFFPYIGLDAGISGGFLENNHNSAKFTVSPIVGFKTHIFNSVLLYASAKYMIVFENSNTKVTTYSIGIQWDFLHVLQPM